MCSQLRCPQQSCYLHWGRRGHARTCARPHASRLGNAGPKDSVSAHRPSRVSWLCVCVSSAQARADNKQMKAAAMGGEDWVEGRSSRARSPSPPPAAPRVHCSRLASCQHFCQPPRATATHWEENRETETAAGTPRDRRVQQPTRRAPPRLSPSPFLTASTQRHSFEPACQDKLTSPIYAPALRVHSGHAVREQRRRGQVHFSPAGLQRRTGHFYAPGMATSGDSGMSPALLSPL